MNLDEFKKLAEYLKKDGYSIQQQHRSIEIDEVNFEKIIPTDDKDIVIEISGTFDWRIRKKK